MPETKLIAVDLQYDFTRQNGLHYKPKRKSVDFICKKVIPFLQEKKIKIGEIISDYRQPRPGDGDESCCPGEWGYQSEIPDEIVETRFIKCMNSPTFSRLKIGNPRIKPGIPFDNPDRFDRWLKRYAGHYTEGAIIILFGLTLDCCVLCTAQAVRFRGYNVHYISEAVDTYVPSPPSKIAADYVIKNWATPISFIEVKRMLEIQQKLLEMEQRYN